MATSTSASIFIKGYNQMTKAVNGAVADLGKIKTAADKASKTLRNVFELGTTVAVLKKVVKLSKEYFNNVTDQKVISSLDKLKQTVNGMKSDLSGFFSDKIATGINKINTWFENAKPDIEILINAVLGIIENFPQAVEITFQTIAKVITNLFDFKNIQPLITTIFKETASMIKQLFSVASIYAEYFVAALEESFNKTSLGQFLDSGKDKSGITRGQDMNNAFADLYAWQNGTYDLNNSAMAKSVKKTAAEILEEANGKVAKIVTSFGEGITSVATDFWGIISPELEALIANLKGLNKNGLFAFGNSSNTDSSISFFKTSILEAITKLKDFVKNLSPIVILIRLIATAVERFLSVLGNGIDTVLQPLFDIFAWAGQIAAEQFMPILERLYPIIQLGAVMIEALTNAVASHLAPVIEFIAAILEILAPILTFVTKAFIVLMAPAQWLADAFKWLADWIKYLGNAIATAVYNIFHPRKQKSMTASKPGEFESNAFSGLSERLARVDSLGSSTAGLTDGTSTSSAIASAPYNGATNVTINIYQQAAVVGDSGMRQFAQMIRNEFEKLDYYGVTA